MKGVFKVSSGAMRRLVLVAALVWLAFSAAVSARMYQWIESGSGIVRLSGDPPPWYRNGAPSPRTLVFDNGRLVDDTAIPLSSDQEEALRSAAFREVDLKQEQDAVRKLERAALREARRREESEAPAETSPDASTSTGAAEPSTGTRAEFGIPAEIGDLDAQTVEQMKSLLSEWDKQQAENGKTP